MTYDISNELNASSVQLEQVAYAKFGAVVDDFNTQQLQSSAAASSNTSSPPANAAGQSIAGTPSATSSPSSGSTWSSLDYATDLIPLAAKHKFLFKVHFHFNPPYVGDRDQSVFSYLIKSISRPKIALEYTDINMYNFRTKVLINIKHESISLDFYDDIGNNVQEFFNTYRRAYSPIARTPIETASAQFETSGMDFASANPYTTLGGDYSASMGQLVNGAINILHYIELEQYFANGTQMNVFKFINPRAESFDFDESTVDANDLHSMKVTFNYDALIIDTHDSSGSTKASFGTQDIMSGTTPWPNASGNPVGSAIVKPSGINSNSGSSYDILQSGPKTGMIMTEEDVGITSQLDTSSRKTLFGASSGVNQGNAGVQTIVPDDSSDSEYA